MIKRIAHTAFTVADMEKAMGFYCGVLGFSKAFSLADDKGNPWIEYIKISDGQFIELFYGNPSANGSQSYSHLCLEVDDINEVAEAIKAKGAVLDVEPNQGKDLNWQCWVRDPDGNRIEFMQMNPESPQAKS
jgi:lactoylglutathione lyase